MVVPGTVAALTRTADIIIGLLLLMLSHGLRRRKHRAWQEVMALLVISALIAWPTRPTCSTTSARRRRPKSAVGLVILLLLIGAGAALRRQFYAVGDPRTRWRALGALIGLLVADVLIGVGYLAGPADLSAGYTFSDKLQTAINGMVGAAGPVAFGPHDLRGDFFATLMGALAFVTVIVTAHLFLRPAEPQGRLGASDAVRIRTLLDKHGDSDSLGYFALRHDKSVIWSPTGKSCIGYRVLSGVMLASGDPLGRPRGMAGRDRRVPRHGGQARLGTRGYRLQRTGRRGLVPERRPDRARARR